MISEERLAELLKTNSTIYTIYGGYVSEIELVFGSDEIEKNHLVELSVNKWGNTHTSYTFDMLFEDRLEAEEFLKYGNVTRIEKFPYVSWEEFCKDGHLQFLNFAHKWCCIYMDKDFLYLVRYYGKRHRETYMKLNVSKENYLKALDIAVKLFKGEEL